MATIRDVAKLAGVAPITASRVINTSGYASEEVRQRVRQAVEQLGYVPNSLARSLRSHQTLMLALILTDVTNPFWTTVARGVEDAASQAGFNVIFCNTDEAQEKQDRYLEMLIQKRVDGILLVPARSHAQSIRFIRQQNVPLVLLDRRLLGIDADIVRCDSEGGAYQLTRLLLGRGHRRIAILSGPPGVSSADDRVAGYCRAILEAGIPQPLIYRGEFTISSGYQMTCAALGAAAGSGRAVNAPSALFASNNFIAIGALKALHDSGVAVPDALSLAAFDDLPAATMIEPFLTVAVQPAYEMGRQATQLLLTRLNDAASAANTSVHRSFQEIILPVAIIERRSIRPPQIPVV